MCLAFPPKPHWYDQWNIEIEYIVLALDIGRDPRCSVPEIKKRVECSFENQNIRQ